MGTVGPVIKGEGAIQVHRRAGEDEQVLALDAEIANPQSIQLQKVFAIGALLRADLVQDQCMRIVRVDVDLQFQNDRPATQYRPAQADEDTSA